MTRRGTVRLGTFDVERRWRPDGLASLPTVRDPTGDRAAAAMDELLAVTCDPGDVLITGAEVPASFLDLFGDIGVEITHRVAPVGAPDSEAGVEQRLLLAPVDDLRGHAFTPYAVLPETQQLVQAYGLRADLPDASTVRGVSSKSWSNALVRELGLFGAGVVVDSVTALLETVAEFGSTPVLLKDPYGVAGRGILEVSSPRVLNTVRRVLTKQVERGARVELLVQPRLDRVVDFGAQFHVTTDGRVRWNGVQVIENVGFSHIGTRPPDDEFQQLLDGAGYRSIMDDVGAALASAGYRGPVCVDSMLLRDGTFVPVLEINPRMSIGLVSILAGRRLERPGTTARLAVRAVRSTDPWETFDSMVGLMRQRGVLFTAGGTGILPLAANTLQTSRGRLHCIVVSRDADEDHRLGAALDLITRTVGEQAPEVSRAS